jgi:uncharacterized membrane protein YoaK (UPF0700 family)
VGASAQQADPWLDAARDFRAPLAALALLAGLAGYCDAVSLLHWDVFVANQSGNVVHTGMGLAGADPAWPQALTSIVSFGLGGAASSLVGRAPGRLVPPAVRLLLAGLTLLVWAGLVALTPAADAVPALPAVAVLAFGMGVVATTFVRLGGVQVATTYATGTVLRALQSAVATVSGPAADRGRAARAGLVSLLMLVSYAGGGAAGTVAVRLLSRPWLVLGGLLLIAAVAALLRRARQEFS